MKNTLVYFFILLPVTVVSSYAQQDTLTQLDEVLLTDGRLYKNSRSQVVTVLQDSTLRESDPSLTNVLKFNSPIYFRENGYGMVSSASFRGTTATQTAVVWNGININSQLNGQTDFNTVNTSGYDNIAIRAGGGSVLYGSGAIGGSVHLNNQFKFNRKFENNLRLDYGSFDTRIARYSAAASSERTSVYINIGGTASENDFSYPGTNRFNENGDFYNLNLSAGLAHWLDERNLLKFHSDFFTGERGFSGTLTAPSRSKFEDVNSRNLVEWKGLYGDVTSSLKLAYVEENYKYFENRHREDFSYGEAQNYIANYDLSYKLGGGITLNGIIDHRTTVGEGSSVERESRNITAFALLFNHDLGRLFYELSARKEFSNVYDSPLLFSAGAGYAVTSFYELNINLSKNFRIPTYNDLFWSPGGNPDLQPETSYQAEVGNNFRFGNFDLGVTGYIIEMKDLLRWVPDRTGQWGPVNTQQVQNYGMEIRTGFNKDLQDHKINITSTYAYTKSRDKELGKELIYVPAHKATAALGYSYKGLSLVYQFLYTGSIYTSSDNSYELDGYELSQVGVGYRPARFKFLKAGLEVRNFFNKEYQSLPSRPMPGRSIMSSLTVNF
jgi:vitamin B12 transporter